MKNFLVIFCLLISLSLLAQWENTLEKSVNWYQISPTGNLVVGAQNGIIGLNETNGSKIYEVTGISDPKEEEFQVIPNTPFGMIIRGQGKLESRLIFNLNDGKILFDSQKEKIIIGKLYLLGSTGDFVVQGLRGMESIFFVIDIATGSIRWEQKDVFGKSIFAEVIDGSPIETPDGNFIIATAGGMSGGSIYCFSPKEGKQVWKAALPKIKGMQTSTKTETKLATSYTEKDKFIYIKGQNIMAYNINTGAQLWSDPAKQKGLPELVIYDPVGLIVSSGIDPNNTLFKPTMAMYDYNTGKDLWEDQVKLKGTVKSYSYCNKGLIIGMENQKGSSLLNVVDIEKGVYIFKDFYKVNGSVAEMKLLESAVYIRTDLEEDLVSLETGKSILSKNVSSKSDVPLVNIRKDNLSFTFNPSNGNLYQTDLKSQTQNLLTEKIEFEQKENPGKIEILNDLLILSSSQTVAGYSTDGKEKFKTHIPAPGISGWKKALYATSAFLNTMDAMRYAELEARAKASSAQAKTPEGREFIDAIGQLANKGASVRLSAASKEMEMVRKRFKASASGNNVQFILGKLENKEYGLIGISKSNGKKLTEINFGKDKEPKYLLDDVSRVIYYLFGASKIKAIKY